MAENQEVLVVFSADIQGMVQNVQAAMASIASSTQIAANKVADAVKQINQAHSSSQGGAKNGASATKGFFDGLKESASKSVGAVSGVIGDITGKLGHFGMMLKGGEAFKEAVSVSVKYAETIEGLGKKLKLTQQQAASLNTALKLSGVSADSYTAASKSLADHMSNNSKQMQQMGLATHDSSGKLRSQREVVADALKILDQYKSGTDRNNAAQALLGISFQEAQEVLGETNESMDEAEKLTTAYGLASGNTASHLGDYKKSLASIEIAIEAVQKTVGDALVPVLTKMGNWFRQDGPEAIGVVIRILKGLGECLGMAFESVEELYNYMLESFNEIRKCVNDVFGDAIPADLDFVGNVIRVLKAAVVVFKTEFSLALEVCRGYSQTFMEVLRMLADVAKAVLNLSWSEVESAWSRGIQRIEKSVTDSAKRMSDIARKRKGQFDDALLGPDEKPAPEKPPESDDGKKKFPDDKKKKSGGKRGAGKNKEISAWEGELDEIKRKDLNERNKKGDLTQFSTDSELRFWEGKLKLLKAGSDSYKNVEKRVAELSRRQIQEDYSIKLEIYSAQMKLEQNMYSLRIYYAEQYHALQVQAYGAESEQARQALRQKESIEQEGKTRQREAEEKQIENREAMRLFDLEMQEQTAQAEAENSDASQKELLALQRKFEDERYAIQRQALMERIALQEKDPGLSEEARQKLKANLAQLDQGHKKKTHGFDLQQQKLDGAPLKNFISTSRGAFEQFVNGILTKTKTLRQGLNELWKQMAQSFIQEFIVKKISAVVFGQNAETAATLAGLAQRGLAEAAAAAKSVAIWAATSIKNIMNCAYEAMAAVFKAFAQMGPWGVVAGVAAGAAAFALVSGMAGNVKSAAGGYDIPAGVNPLTQLHAEEMVLPAEHAKTIRSLKDGNTAGGGMTVHLNVSAVDGASVKRMLIDNKHHVAAALQSAVRNNWRPA